MLAARSGNTLAVSKLLHHGADLRITSSDRRSALYVAREYKHKEVAKILLNAGAEKLPAPVPLGKREKKAAQS